MRHGIYQLGPDPGFRPGTKIYDFAGSLIDVQKPGWPPYHPKPPQGITHYRPPASHAVGPVPGMGQHGGARAGGGGGGFRPDPFAGVRANQAALERARAADAARAEASRRAAEQARKQAEDAARRAAEQASQQARDAARQAAERAREQAARQQREREEGRRRRDERELRDRIRRQQKPSGGGLRHLLDRIRGRQAAPAGRRPDAAPLPPRREGAAPLAPRSSPPLRLDPAHGLRVSPDRQRPTVHEPTFISQMDLGAAAGGNDKCYPAAHMMAVEGLRGEARELDDKYDRIQVARGEADAQGRIRSDPAKAAELIRYVDKVLDDGRRALVGVSVGHRTSTEIPDDRVTGHYVVLYGRGYEPDGRVYYRFKDPGTAGEGASARFADGRFYVDEATGILFRRGENPASDKVPLRDYEVSHVRVYRTDKRP